MPPPGDVPPLHGDTPIPPTPQRFQEVEEAHLRHMKGLIGSYSHSVEDTHVQIGQVSPPSPPQSHGDTPRVPLCIPLHRSLQVHEEFKQNVENIGTETLLRRFAESKGTGRERPGEEGGGGGGTVPSWGGSAVHGDTAALMADPTFALRHAGFRGVPPGPSAGRRVRLPPTQPRAGGCSGGGCSLLCAPPPSTPTSGPKRSRSKAFRIPGLSRKERERDAG